MTELSGLMISHSTGRLLRVARAKSIFARSIGATAMSYKTASPAIIVVGRSYFASAHHTDAVETWWRSHCTTIVRRGYAQQRTRAGFQRCSHVRHEMLTDLASRTNP